MRVWRRRLRVSPARYRLQVKDQLIAAVAHEGDADAALALCVSNAARHIRRLDRFRSASPRGPVRRVFVGGFYQSGSSAVMDYLRGYGRVTVWTPRAEMRLIESVGGFADLAARHAKHGELRPADLVDHYLHLTGQKVHATPARAYDQWRAVNQNSRQLFEIPRAAGYLRTCLAGFLDLVDLTTTGSPATSELERLFRRTIARALDQAAQSARADVILVNQGIRPFRLRNARLVPPSTFVIVHRDPRDQFVDAQDKRRRSGRPEQSVPEFVTSYRWKRVSAERHLPGIERAHGHRAVQIGFEEFVHDPAAVRALTEFLGFADRPYRQGAFDARRARASVGKHRDRLSPAVRTRLVAALPDYIVAAAGTATPAARPVSPRPGAAAPTAARPATPAPTAAGDGPPASA